MHVRQRLGASERPRVSRTGSAALDSASGEEGAGRRVGATHGRDTVGEPVRQVRVSTDHEPATHRGLGGETTSVWSGIWRQEGLKVPRRQPKRGRLWLNDGSCIRLRPLHKNHVWSYDFVSTRTHDGRALKLLTVLDEYTRRCLAIRVGRRTRSDDVLEVLADLFARHGPPEHLRSDNGPEFTAKRGAQVAGQVAGSRPSTSRRAVRGRTATTRASTAS